MEHAIRHCKKREAQRCIRERQRGYKKRPLHNLSKIACNKLRATVLPQTKNHNSHKRHKLPQSALLPQNILNPQHIPLPRRTRRTRTPPPPLPHVLRIRLLGAGQPLPRRARRHRAQLHLPAAVQVVGGVEAGLEALEELVDVEGAEHDDVEARDRLRDDGGVPGCVELVVVVGSGIRAVGAEEGPDPDYARGYYAR